LPKIGGPSSQTCVTKLSFSDGLTMTSWLERKYHRNE